MIRTRLLLFCLVLTLVWLGILLGRPNPSRSIKRYNRVASLPLEDAGDDASLAAELETLADLEKPRWQGLVAFLRGSLAFRRSALSEQQAQVPGADARAMQAALSAAEDALLAWRRAAQSRADWPEAGRNVERALLRLARLRERRRTSGNTKPPATQPGDDTKPDAPDPSASKPPETPGDPNTEPPKPGAGSLIERRDLPADRVLGLLQLLRKQEARKQALRRSVRHARSSQVERDW